MDNRELKVFLLGGGALIAFMIFMGSQLTAQTNAENTKPPKTSSATSATEPIDYIQDRDSMSRRILQWAIRTKGDFSLLTPQEQQTLNSATREHGMELLKGRYQDYLRTQRTKTQAAQKHKVPIVR